MTCSLGNVRSSLACGLVGWGDGDFCRDGVEFLLEGDKLLVLESEDGRPLLDLPAILPIKNNFIMTRHITVKPVLSS